MARGGARPGAGRKPGSKRWGKVVGIRERPSAMPPIPPLDAPVDDADGLLSPPADLAPAEQAVWRELAPHAVRERTLTPSRVPGFRQLCRQWVYAAEIDAQIRTLGITSEQADRLLRHFDKWEKALAASLGNFSIRSFGKPAVAEKPKPAAGGWVLFGASGGPHGRA